jgi:hypothetical protein
MDPYFRVKIKGLKRYAENAWRVFGKNKGTLILPRNVSSVEKIFIRIGIPLLRVRIKINIATGNVTILSDTNNVFCD